MKKFFKVILIIVILILLAIGGFVAWLNFSKSKSDDVVSIIPADAVFIIKSENLTESWHTLQESRFWKTFNNYHDFRQIDKNINSVDSMIKKNKALDYLFSNRRMAISIHNISKEEFAFLFIVDLEKSSKISFLNKAIPFLTNFTIKNKKLNNIEIVEIADNQSKNKAYFAVIDNLFIASASDSLLNKVIAKSKDRYWITNKDFQKINEKALNKKQITLYVNYQHFDDFFKIYFTELPDLTSEITKTLTYSALQSDFKDESFSATGLSDVIKTPTYFKTLLNVKAGRMMGYKVVSEQTSSYFSACFENYDDFYKAFLNSSSLIDQGQTDQYIKETSELHTQFDIDIKDEFFSWIGNEVALVKLRNSGKQDEDRNIMILHAKNLEKAKIGMASIAAKIAIKTKSRTENITYRNYQITYLDKKNFFELFFGKWFKTINNPYFTFLRDYVVVANSVELLKYHIDEYLAGKTIGKNPEFAKFFEDFSGKTNFALFVQTPKLFPELQKYSRQTSKPKLESNKTMISSLSRIGYQLIADKDKLRTKLFIQHDKYAPQKDKIEDLEYQAISDLSTEYFESLAFKLELNDKYLKKDRKIKVYHNDTLLFAEGAIEDKKLNGLWKTYYPNGKVKSAVHYNEGDLYGDAYFYFDNDKHTKWAEIIYDNNQMVNVFTEYYQNGNQKAVINYVKGKKEGDAKFYYKNGKIKIEGQYHEGVKTGDWNYYSENGKLIEKNSLDNKPI